MKFEPTHSLPILALLSLPSIRSCLLCSLLSTHSLSLCLSSSEPLRWHGRRTHPPPRAVHPRRAPAPSHPAPPRSSAAPLRTGAPEPQPTAAVTSPSGGYTLLSREERARRTDAARLRLYDPRRRRCSLGESASTDTGSEGGSRLHQKRKLVREKGFSSNKARRREDSDVPLASSMVLRTPLRSATVRNPTACSLCVCVRQRTRTISVGSHAQSTAATCQASYLVEVRVACVETL